MTHSLNAKYYLHNCLLSVKKITDTVEFIFCNHSFKEFTLNDRKHLQEAKTSEGQGEI